MDRDNVFEIIQNLFRDVFDDDEIILTDETTANDIDEWDSLQNITILAAIEEDFGIKFQISEARHLVNIGALVDLVVNKVNKN